MLLYPQVKSSRRKKNQLLKSFRSRFESRRWFRGRGRRGRIRWKEERERRKRFEEGNDASRVCPKITDGEVGRAGIIVKKMRGCMTTEKTFRTDSSGGLLQK